MIGAGTPAEPLKHVMLGGGTENEGWLQALIAAHPSLLPIAEIEPGFGDLVSIATEVPCGHGYIDNLYLTPTGDIVIAEAKLWRNPQARREVVAQTLDYVAALTRMDYTAFEKAVLKSVRTSGAPATLHGHVAGHPEAPDEPRFIDAVARNLKRGRMIALVIGDGIREEAQVLGQLLQSHAGAHFTFALVELSVWRHGDCGPLLVMPSVLARTVMIERGIVRLVDDRIEVVPHITRPEMDKAQSITEQDFYEQLALVDAAMPDQLRAFIAMLEPLGVYAEILKTLNLKAMVATSPKPHNFGYVGTTGKLKTSTLAWTAGEAIALRYNQALANLIGGTVATYNGIYLALANGKAMPLISALLPKHADAWAGIIASTIADLEKQSVEQP